MQDESYFIIKRRLLTEHWLSPLTRLKKNTNEKFTEFEAWIYLISSALYFCKKIEVNKELITVKRGSFICSVSQLSSVWNWNRRTTEKFLNLLEKDGIITRTKINHKNIKSCTILKLNNYNDIQPNISGICTSECTTECTTECTLNKKEKKEKKENYKEKNFKKFFNFIPTVGDFEFT